ncbi:MAG: class I SAM-dependent methyltransferase [Planctomycetota bacterium]
MADAERMMEVFLDVQRGLPRQGPGLAECTRRALQMCGDLPAASRVLDVGCGPGLQTLVLAEALPEASITALDLTREYLDQLERRVDKAELGSRVAVVEGDMSAMPFAEASFDLIWSEGAAYSMGFDNAVRDWRRLLAPDGFLAVSELVWLREEPPIEVAAYFGAEYPQMAFHEDVAERFRGFGYELIGHFTLPDAAWWDDYYGALEKKLPALREKYAGDEDALSIVAGTATEISMRRRYASTYGYEFFVARLRG